MALAANVHEPMAAPWVDLDRWFFGIASCYGYAVGDLAVGFGILLHLFMSLPSGFGRWILVLSVATGRYTLFPSHGGTVGS